MSGPIHICRDLVATAPFPYGSMYLSSLFLTGVLGYSVVGQTGFNIAAACSGSGPNASINNVAGASVYSVQVTGSYVVSGADVGRILALRSNANPSYNSGLFRVTGISSSINAFVIDYRSPDSPPPEVGTLNWSIFGPETALGTSLNGDPGNGSAGYSSRGPNFVGKRIILQSPHSSSWQVRYCYESQTTRYALGLHLSVAPGFNGDSRGDFPSGTFDASQTPVEHLHVPMWYDADSSNYVGGAVATGGAQTGFNYDEGTVSVRFYAWGDSVSGSAHFVYRNLTNTADCMYFFGMGEDDEPAPPRISQKLYVFGRPGSTAAHLDWDNGAATKGDMSGIAFGLNGRPVSCVLIDWVPIGSPTLNPTFRFSSIAQDNVMLNATELRSPDLWAGTLETGNDLGVWPSEAIYEYDPRRIGSLPIGKVGRANFGTWSLTNDVNRSWFHTKNGVFLPWGGPSVLQ